jgi:hypothetical protein
MKFTMVERGGGAWAVLKNGRMAGMISVNDGVMWVDVGGFDDHQVRLMTEAICSVQWRRQRKNPHEPKRLAEDSDYGDSTWET